jgi:hypothetical protein
VGVVVEELADVSHEALYDGREGDPRDIPDLVVGEVVVLPDGLCLCVAVDGRGLEGGELGAVLDLPELLGGELDGRGGGELWNG